MTSLIGLSCLAGVLVCCGCAPAEKPFPNTIPFSGKVLLDGKPLDHAIVAFVTDEETLGAPLTISGLTDEYGDYELVTRIGEKEQPGALPGNYKVVVVRFLMGASPDGERQQRVVPARYSDPEQTTLNATIPDDGGTQDFELKSS